MTIVDNTFSSHLESANLCASIQQSEDLYAGLIGSWELEVLHYRGKPTQLRGEVHFSRTLLGRAVQDVWLIPSEEDGSATPPYLLYGTTLRVWDPGTGTWRVSWVNVTNGKRDELVGRQSGSKIVQLGTHQDGTTIRWVFSDVQEKSFHWIGEMLQSDGHTWIVESEFIGHRFNGASPMP